MIAARLKIKKKINIHENTHSYESHWLTIKLAACSDIFRSKCQHNSIGYFEKKSTKEQLPAENAVSMESFLSLRKGTLLANCDVFEVPVPLTDQSVLAMRIKNDDALSMWESARSLLNETKRWPVLFLSWGQDMEEALERDCFQGELFEGNRTGLSVQDLVQGALAIDLDSTYQKLMESRNGLPAAQTAHLNWFEPNHEDQYLLLLPTISSWQVPAFIQWYGSDCIDSEITLAQLKQWSEDFDAELVAHYGTMLHLKAGKKPECIDKALKLAYQQDVLAPCTLALPSVTIVEQAVSLMETEKWFLHERPQPSAGLQNHFA